jgi:MFS family permease
MPGSVERGGRSGAVTAPAAGRAAAALRWVRARVAPPEGESQPIVRRALSDTTRPWRGASVAFLGGALIVLVAMTISEGYFNFGVAERGQVIGLIICALALTALSAPHSAPVLGAGIVVAGVVSFPIGLGGLIAGALLSVLGGGLVAAWSLPPSRAVLRIVPAPAWSRLGAFAIDLVILLGASFFLRGVADDAVGKSNPILYVLPLTIWAVLRGWCSSQFGWTPGKLFVGLRVRDSRRSGPPSFRIAFVREIGLLIGVTVVAWAGAVAFNALLGSDGEVNVVVLGVVGVPLAVIGLLLLGRRRLPHDRLLRTQVVSQRVVLGPAVARPTRRSTRVTNPSRGAGRKGTRTA